MARNVGSIEVSVEADTGKLKAQLVKDGRAAGSAAKKAIEKELRNVEAEVDLNTTKARAELKQFKKAIDRVDGEIEIGFDEKGMEEDLARVQAEIDAVTGDLELSLDKNSVAAVKAELKEIEAGFAETLEYQLVVDPKYKAQFEAQLKYYENRKLELEAKLELDDKALRAKLEILESEKRDIEFGLEFAPKARAILEAQLKRIEVEDRTIEIEAILNERKALAALEALEEKKVRVDGIFDASRMTAEYESWAERIEAQKVAARIDGDWTDFNLSLKELKAKVALEEFEVNVNADVLDAIAELEALQAEIDSTDARIPVDADLSKIREALTVFRQFQEHNAIEVPINADVDSLEAALARAEARAAVGGESAGQSYGKGFGSGLSILPGAIAQWAPLVGIALGPAVQAVEGMIGSAVQVVSSGFSAMGGAAGAAAPIVAGLGAVMGAIVVGSLGMGDAVKASAEAFTEMESTGTVSEETLKKVDKAMRQLTPAAQGAAQAIAEMFPQLRAIQTAVAGKLFEGMAVELRSLSTETIPDIGTALGLAAESANAFGRQVMAALREIDFTGTFEAVQPAIDSLGRAIANVVRAIEPFLKAAAPAARELAQWIEEASQSFLGMVRSGAASGKITDFLMEGVSSLKDWARLVGAVGDALGTLFEAGKSGGDGMIRSLTDIVEKFDSWMESTKGQKALQQFFETSRQLMSDMVPLIKGIGDAIGNIVTPAAGASFRDLTTNLGDVIRVAGELINVFNRMNITGTVVAALGIFARALEPIIPSLQTLADAISGSLGDALVAATPMIEGLASMVGMLAQVLTPLAPVIVAIGVAFAGWKVISGISGMITGVTTSISGMGETLGKVQGAIRDLPAAASLTGTAFGQIGASMAKLDFQGVKAGFSDLGVTLPALAKGVGAAAGTGIAAGLGIAFGAQMAMTSKDIGGQVTGLATVVSSALTAFAVGGPIVGGIALAIGAITTLFQQSAANAKKATAEIKEYSDALLEIGDSASSVAVVKTVLKNLGDESQKTKDTFDELGFSVGDWARTMADGAGDAKSGMMDFVSTVGPAGKEVAKMLDEGKISAEQLADTFKGVAMPEALPGELQGLGMELKAIGLNSKEAGELFDFLYDESTELGAAAEKNAQDARLAGDGLKEMGDSAADATGTTETLGSVAGELAPTLAEVAESAGMTAEAFAAFESSAGDVASKIGAIEGPVSAAVASLREVAAATEEGAAAAEGMRTAFDALISPFVTGEQAWVGYQAAVDDLTASLEENGATMDTTTEAGRANTEAALAGVESIGAWGEAALAAGTDAAFVEETMRNMRSELIDRLAPAFAGNAEAAAAWIDKLNLTPDAISVIVETPGLLEAMENITGYDRDLDGIEDPVDAFIQTPGLDDVKSALEGYGVDLAGVPDEVITQWIAENLQPSIDAANELKRTGEELDGQVVGPTIEPVGLAEADAAVGSTWDVFKGFDAWTGGPTVTEEGAAATTTAMEGVGTATDQVDGKKATVSAEVMNNMIVMMQLVAIQAQMEAIDSLNAAVTVSVTGADTATTAVTGLKKAVDGLAAKTVDVGQTGAQAAKSAVDAFDESIDGLAPKSVTIGQTGAQAAETAVKNFDKAIDSLSPKTVAIGQTGAQSAQSAVDAFDRAISGLQSKTVTIAQSGAGAAETAVKNLDSAIDKLVGKTVTVTANVNGLQSVRDLDREIDGLRDRTVTITTNNVTRNSTVNSMAGRLVTGPMTSALGERGYAEAVVPLQLPLNRIDPSVRHIAEMIRTGSPAPTVAGAGRVVNNYMTITPASADPGAVATQIVNRAATLANR